ncbi:MAG: F0F1 ATP synthase subunit delta [Alphaproteobacteria bacterium]|nr:F0F1 ATP synthase subunit delta [Alphaproteobacteria bacterium]
MSIDWFTLIAQIFNLLILLFLLRKFLYLPVLKAVETRQKFIEDELEKAAQSRIKAEKAEKLCLQKAQKIEREKQKVLADVHREAEKLAVDLREQAEKQYRQSKQEWKAHLLSEQKNFNTALQVLVAEHFSRFAEKALRQMANLDLNEWIIKQFMQKIENLPNEEKNRLKENLQSQQAVSLQSARELSPEFKKQIENFLRQECNVTDKVKLNYKINNDLVGGIVLRSGEYMIEWSLNGYLQEFKQTMTKEVSLLINRGVQ